MSNQQDVTTNEIMDFLAENMVTKKEFNERMEKMEGQVDKIEGRMDKMETSMVTMEYLDSKLLDLRDDLVVLMRKEDEKLVKLVEILKNKEVLTEEEVKNIISMRPFAKLAL